MSEATALPLGPSRPGLRGLSVIGWSVLAVSVSVVQALAVFLDWKLGLAVCVAIIAAWMLVSQPELLLPLAVMTMFLEDVTFSGQAISRLLAPAALLVTAIELLRGTGRIRPGLPLACAGGYVAWAVASGMWTQSAAGTSFMLQSLGIALVWMLAFASLLNSVGDLRRILLVIAFTAATVGGLSVIAFGTNFTIPTIDLLQAGRSQGAVGDPDFFAGMQLVAIPLVLVAAGEAQGRLRVALYGSLCPILASVFTSLSRGGFIAFVVLNVLLLVSRPGRIFGSRREKAVALFVIVIGMMVLFSRPFVRDTVVSRVQSIYAPKDANEKSGSGRTNLWLAARRAIRENPATGIGYGSFAHVSQELVLTTPGVDLEVYVLRAEGDNLVPHNTYLGTAAELGYPGLLLYLSVVGGTMLYLRRAARVALERGAEYVARVANALVAGLASWMVTTIFLSAETTRMLWIIVGISLALPKLIPPPASSSPRSG